MTRRPIPLLASMGFVLATGGLARSEAPANALPITPGGVPFVMHKIGTFRSEACGVGDFNGDGKLDIVAGPYIYLAPDWKPVKIRTIKGGVNDQGKGYYNDFMNAPIDVDGDGKLDVASCDWFGKKATWYRNIGLGGGEWLEQLIELNGNFESGDLWDMEGKGKRNAIMPMCQRVVWYELAPGPDGKPAFQIHVVSEKKCVWGGGVGDVNGDGRPDIIRPNAWFEAPDDIRKGVWKEHPLALGHRQEGKTDDTAQIWTYDVNNDGLNDIICSSAHKHGVFWYQQIREGTTVKWKQHIIDDSWSQAHSLTLVDIDKCGVPEIITGKRFMAHNGSDPDETGPLGIYYYKLKRGPTPVWTKYAVTYNEGIGAGMSIEVVDLDGDGDLDIVTTGKFGGPVWFESKLK